eukprot:gene22272-28386_t
MVQRKKPHQGQQQPKATNTTKRRPKTVSVLSGHEESDSAAVEYHNEQSGGDGDDYGPDQSQSSDLVAVSAGGQSDSDQVTAGVALIARLDAEADLLKQLGNAVLVGDDLPALRSALALHSNMQPPCTNPLATQLATQAADLVVRLEQVEVLNKDLHLAIQSRAHELLIKCNARAKELDFTSNEVTAGVALIARLDAEVALIKEIEHASARESLDEIIMLQAQCFDQGLHLLKSYETVIFNFNELKLKLSVAAALNKESLEVTHCLAMHAAIESNDIATLVKALAEFDNLEDSCLSPEVAAEARAALMKHVQNWHKIVTPGGVMSDVCCDCAIQGRVKKQQRSSTKAEHSQQQQPMEVDGQEVPVVDHDWSCGGDEDTATGGLGSIVRSTTKRKLVVPVQNIVSAKRRRVKVASHTSRLLMPVKLAPIRPKPLQARSVALSVVTRPNADESTEGGSSAAEDCSTGGDDLTVVSALTMSTMSLSEHTQWDPVCPPLSTILEDDSDSQRSSKFNDSSSSSSSSQSTDVSNGGRQSADVSNGRQSADVSNGRQSADVSNGRQSAQLNKYQAPLVVLPPRVKPPTPVVDDATEEVSEHDASVPQTEQNLPVLDVDHKRLLMCEFRDCTHFEVKRTVKKRTNQNYFYEIQGAAIDKSLIEYVVPQNTVAQRVVDTTSCINKQDGSVYPHQTHAGFLIVDSVAMASLGRETGKGGKEVQEVLCWSQVISITMGGHRNLESPSLALGSNTKCILTKYGNPRLSVCPLAVTSNRSSEDKKHLTTDFFVSWKMRNNTLEVLQDMSSFTTGKGVLMYRHNPKAAWEQVAPEEARPLVHNCSFYIERTGVSHEHPHRGEVFTYVDTRKTEGFSGVMADHSRYYIVKYKNQVSKPREVVGSYTERLRKDRYQCDQIVQSCEPGLSTFNKTYRAFTVRDAVPPPKNGRDTRTEEEKWVWAYLELLHARDPTRDWVVIMVSPDNNCFYHNLAVLYLLVMRVIDPPFYHQIRCQICDTLLQVIDLDECPGDPSLSMLDYYQRVREKLRGCQEELDISGKSLPLVEPVFKYVDYKDVKAKDKQSAIVKAREENVQRNVKSREWTKTYGHVNTAYLEKCRSNREVVRRQFVNDQTTKDRLPGDFNPDLHILGAALLMRRNIQVSSYNGIKAKHVEFYTPGDGRVDSDEVLQLCINSSWKHWCCAVSSEQMSQFTAPTEIKTLETHMDDGTKFPEGVKRKSRR